MEKLPNNFAEKRRLNFHFVEKERSLENDTGGVVFSVVISPDEQV